MFAQQQPALHKRLLPKAVAGIVLLTVLGLALAFLTGVLPRGSAAGAASNPNAQSTFTKTGVDVQSNATATATQSQPAAGGDTVTWALNYQNTSKSSAAVNITDPLTDGQTYVAGSLHAPPGFTTTAPSAANASTVSATGTAALGTTAAQSPDFAPSMLTIKTTGGDGFTVEGFGGNLYTVFHHNNSATKVFCATLADQVCAGWPGFSSYVAAASGTPIGKGPSSDLTTASENGSFIVGDKLFWPEQKLLPTGGPFAVGMGCLDLTSVQSCGFTQLDTVTNLLTTTNTTTGKTNSVGFIAGDGMAADNGNRYYLDSNGTLLCFAASTDSACGTWNVTGGVTGQNVTGFALEGTYGSYVFATYLTSNTKTSLVCFDTSTNTVCGGGYPIAIGASDGSAIAGEVMPVVSATGTVLGACGVFQQTCLSPLGANIPNPYTAQSYATGTAGFGSGVLIGSRYFTIVAANNTGCFDFAQRVGTGAVPACAAFATQTNTRGYTERALANVPGCMAADGDAGDIVLFNQETGAPCATASQSVALTPADYYCDGKPGHAVSWGTVSLTGGVTPADYLGATVTLLGVNGKPVTGWSNVPFPAGQTTIDISALPVSGNSAKLTAQVNLSGVVNITNVSNATVRMTWIGDPIQVCYQTTMPPVPCAATAPVVVSNTATAETTPAASGVADGGNSSGPVSFNVTAAPGSCLLHITKTADKAQAQTGDVVNYTITVTNAGTEAFPDPSITDDLSAVLDDATLVDPANAITVSPAADGTASYDSSSKTLSWSWVGGSLAPGDQVSIGYQVKVKTPDTGNHGLANTVVSPNPSNCQQGSTDPVCTVTVAIGDLTVVKTSNPASGTVVDAGQTVTYTLKFANVGTAPVTVGYTDDLTDVLDDATSNGSPQLTTNGNAVTAVGIGSDQLSVTGTIAGGSSVTVTYGVTVKADGQRGNDKLINYLFRAGTTPPTTCAVGNPLCTINPVQPPPPPVTTPPVTTPPVTTPPVTTPPVTTPPVTTPPVTTPPVTTPPVTTPPVTTPPVTTPPVTTPPVTTPPVTTPPVTTPPVTTPPVTTPPVTTPPVTTPPVTTPPVTTPPVTTPPVTTPPVTTPPVTTPPVTSKPATTHPRSSVPVKPPTATGVGIHRPPLAFTGTSSALMVSFAGVLLALGGLMIAGGRRRRLGHNREH